MLLFEYFRLVTEVIRLLQHFDWSDIIEKSWYIFIPVIQLEEFPWWLRPILIEEILTDRHEPGLTLFLGDSLILHLYRLISFTAERWQVAFPDHPSPVNKQAWTFRVAWIRLSHLFLTYTVTLLAASDNLKLAFV